MVTSLVVFSSVNRMVVRVISFVARFVHVCILGMAQVMATSGARQAIADLRCKNVPWGTTLRSKLTMQSIAVLWERGFGRIIDESFIKGDLGLYDSELKARV